MRPDEVLPPSMTRVTSAPCILCGRPVVFDFEESVHGDSTSYPDGGSFFCQAVVCPDEPRRFHTHGRWFAYHRYACVKGTGPIPGGLHPRNVGEAPTPQPIPPKATT